jgi:hypothetical protein
MRLIKSEKTAILVTPIPNRSGEVTVRDLKLDNPDEWLCIIPDLKMREILWIQFLVHGFDRFAPSKGDGILVRKSELMKSKLLTRRQIYEVNTGLIK